MQIFLEENGPQNSLSFETNIQAINLVLNEQEGEKCSIGC